MKTASKRTISPLAKLVRTWWAIALLLTTVSATGCSWFFPPEPRQPETVQEFIRQDRLGNGIIGN